MEHTGLLRSTLYLVRPDGYLGFVDPHADPERLRAYYFDNAPELSGYLLSVPPTQRLAVMGLRGGYGQSLRTVAGMVAVITAVLTGAEVGLAIAAGVDAPGASFASGGLVALAVLVALMRYQRSTWEAAYRAPIFEDKSLAA